MPCGGLQDGDNAAIWAAQYGFADCLKVLVEAGADLGVANKVRLLPFAMSVCMGGRGRKEGSREGGLPARRQGPCGVRGCLLPFPGTEGGCLGVPRRGHSRRLPGPYPWGHPPLPAVASLRPLLPPCVAVLRDGCGVPEEWDAASG